MKIIDRYILKELMGPFLFGVFAFTSIFIGTDILFELAGLMIDWGVSMGTAGKLFLLSLPEVVVLTFPMAMLLATLLSLGRLSGDSEVVALKAGGVSFIRLVIPVLVVALLISGLTIFLNETLVPTSKDSYRQIVWDIKHREKMPTTQKNLRMTPIDKKTGKVDYIFYAYRFDGSDLTMDDVTLQDYSNGKLVQVIEAKKARWTDEQWQFIDGTIYDVNSKGLVPSMKFNKYFVKKLKRTPSEVSRAQKDPDEMSLKELSKRIKIREEEGRKTASLKVLYYQRYAIPFSCFIFALIGAPLGVQPNRSGASIGLGLSIVIIFIYYTFMTIGSTLGQAGTLSPILGAWLQNIVFAIVGIGLMIKSAR
ncbi:MULTISPECIES: LptF/LptG family permease [unclassified Candidatus Frackibacter]|uniref:LptF/LptG family permease n=1 Tax=unclassified Candidatus Frackibacter TaxID=2648818 RepID=UPI000889247E|nr:MULTISPECIES: LptF/LptG family permease [unclassified Candidatus Frackibacter]SDC09087.1 lipopolysaccharide export system permease protein [Candidatus Frackibacter sp. WG11]SEM37955.1 lipopolysaccharide export system permease protein [Candidatus Frackibacter sp. WG12]SFL43451.1 lipopolysaccharide export system permease protein [Candidatus Frackibacter sp. WG13]